MLKKLCITSLPAFALLVAMPTVASATGYIEARLVANQSEIEADGDKFEVDTTGYEFRGAFDINDQVGARFSYIGLDGDKVTFEGDDFDVDTTFKFLRIGPTIKFSDVGTNMKFYGAAEYVKFTVGAEGEDDSEGGFDLAIGLADKGKTKLLWDAEVGYIKIQDSTGGFVQGSIGYRITPSLALLVGIQSYAVEKGDITFMNGTAGVRFSF